MLRSLWFCYNAATFSDSGSVDQLQTCLLFGDNNKRVWHMTDQTLENKSVNSCNRYNLMKNLIDQCHSWWVRVGPRGWAYVYQCCHFTVIFWGGTLGEGGGGGYSWYYTCICKVGCHWTSKCMGHIESKIPNLKGLLRVFIPYFYWCVWHIKVQRLRLYSHKLFI